MNHKLAQSFFSSAIRSDRAWVDKGVQLLRSAELVLREALRATDGYKTILEGPTRELTSEEIEILERHRQHEAGFFLVALAVENLLKGLWVALNAKQIGTVSHIKKDLGDHFGHDQVEISRKCGFTVSIDEVELLAGFTEMAEWVGKYHVPLRVDDYRTHLSRGSIGWRLFEAATPDDPWSPRVSALIEHIAAAIHKARSQANKGVDPTPVSAPENSGGAIVPSRH